MYWLKLVLGLILTIIPTFLGINTFFLILGVPLIEFDKNYAIFLAAGDVSGLILVFYGIMLYCGIILLKDLKKTND